MPSEGEKRLRLAIESIQLTSGMDKVIDSRQLRAFVTLARAGSYTKTATQLGLTQSAISHSIKHLEDDLGCALFHRVGRKVTLSPHGKRFLHHAEIILQEMAQARVAMHALDQVDRGRLRLGCSLAASQFILPGVLREFKECFPKYVISVSPADTPEAVTLLEQGGIDLAICLQPPDLRKFTARKIFVDELCLMTGPMHPWAATGQVSRSQLGQQHYILYDRRSLTFQMIESYLGRHGVKLKSFIELPSMEAMKELVKLGLGVGIAAPWVARKELAEKSIVALPLGRGAPRRQWVVAALRHRSLSLAEETFIGLCEAVGVEFER